MIYSYPRLGAEDLQVIKLIHQLRTELQYLTSQNPVRWNGFLRRNTFARALQGSNSIEGINASLAEAVAIVDDDKPETLEQETLEALKGYRAAMTYVLRLHDDPHFEFNAQFVRSLHFMMLSYDMTKLPGQWRPGPIYVVREATDETVYEGPDAAAVPALMQEMVAQANNMLGKHDAIVVAAMAHLNLAMIHPFRDGNGRMARAVQTFVLARERIVSPEFSSIEEWLGRNTDAYYAVLEKTGQGRWKPQNSAYDWVRFCLIAHYQQAATIKKRGIQVGRIWSEIDETIIRPNKLNERAQIALMDAAFGYQVRNLRYRSENGLSEVVASRDLKLLCDLELLTPVGEKRGRYYVAGPVIAALARKYADRSKVANPYDLVAGPDADKTQLSLGL